MITEKMISPRTGKKCKKLKRAIIETQSEEDSIEKGKS